MQEARHIGHLGDTKATKWKAASKKTAAELLERNDNGELKLTEAQRSILVERAGKNYKPANPLERRKGETVESYMARLKKLFAK